jgi:hypothetical protein
MSNTSRKLRSRGDWNVGSPITRHRPVQYRIHVGTISRSIQTLRQFAGRKKQALQDINRSPGRAPTDLRPIEKERDG